MSESDFQGPARGRPRSAATEQAIFSAARALLTEEGYDGVTIEGVARRAGVGKQTIYRRFDGKAQLLIAAFRDDAELMVALPTSDTLEEALSVYLSSVFKAVNNSRAALKFLMAQAQIDPAFGATFDKDFIAQRRRTLTQIISRHAQNSSAADISTCVDMLFGAMWYRLLLGHAPLNAGFATKLARRAARILGA